MPSRDRDNVRGLWAAATLFLAGCAGTGGAGGDDWKSLLDPAAASGWETSPFGGTAEPRIEGGTLLIPSGEPMVGVRWTREFPTDDYEIKLEAMRVEGNDFFCGLTFPVKDSHASLIVGGWGGGVCGVSSFNGRDASENETASYREFEKGKWYRIRLRVAGDAIEAWIDDEQIVETEIGGRNVDIRPDIAPSKPLGLTTYRTQSSIRNLEWRRVPAASS